MFINDKSIKSLRELFVEFKKYLELQKEYTKVEIAEKLTLLLSMLILTLLIVMLGMVALFYFSFMLAYLLAPLVGGLVGGFAIIGCFCLLIIGLLLLFRKELIVNPMANFLASIFLDKHNS